MNTDPLYPDRLPLAPVAPRAETSPRRAGVPQRTLLVTSQQLFAGAVEVQIEHHGALYRLKQTSLGKLILTK